MKMYLYFICSFLFFACNLRVEKNREIVELPKYKKDSLLNILERKNKKIIFNNAFRRRNGMSIIDSNDYVPKIHNLREQLEYHYKDLSNIPSNIPYQINVNQHEYHYKDWYKLDEDYIWGITYKIEENRVMSISSDKYSHKYRGGWTDYVTKIKYARDLKIISPEDTIFYGTSTKLSIKRSNVQTDFYDIIDSIVINKQNLN